MKPGKFEVRTLVPRKPRNLLRTIAPYGSDLPPPVRTMSEVLDILFFDGFPYQLLESYHTTHRQSNGHQLIDEIFGDNC